MSNCAILGYPANAATNILYSQPLALSQNQSASADEHPPIAEQQPAAQNQTADPITAQSATAQSTTTQPIAADQQSQSNANSSATGTPENGEADNPNAGQSDPAVDDGFDDMLEIDPNAPLDPIDNIEVEWPDIDQHLPEWPIGGEIVDAPQVDQAPARAEENSQFAEDVGEEFAEESPSDPALEQEAQQQLVDRDETNPDAVDLSETSPADATGQGANGQEAQQAASQDRPGFLNDGEEIGQFARRELSYDYRLDFEGEFDPDSVSRDAFILRFDGLSTLKLLQEDPANLAQLNRRASQDLDLVEQLLRVYGYYDGMVYQQLAREEQQNRVNIQFDINQGPLYRLGQINLPGLEASGSDQDVLRATLGLQSGDPVDSDKIELGRTAIASEMRRIGYVWSEADDPSLVIDHAERAGALTLPITTGGKYRIGTIKPDDEKLLSSRHLQRIARFDSGDYYNAEMVEDLRRAILATGLVSSAEMTPIKASEAQNIPGDGNYEAGVVDIGVAMIPAPPRTIAGSIGYGTGEGLRAEASWEHRNFFPPEGLLRLRGVLGTQEQLANIYYRRNNFLKRDQALTAQLLAANIDRDAYAARTLLASVGFERTTNLIFQKKWTWSIGGEVLATDERDGPVNGINTERRTFYITALPASLYYDGSDDLLDPTSGFRLGGRISPELSFRDGAKTYLRAQIDSSAYQPVSDNLVVAGRVRLGGVFGTGLENIAPSRRNYAGGGGSVRGYGYQDIGPRNTIDDPSGGLGLTEFSLEARYHFGDWGIVPFIDAGNVYESQYPRLSDLRFGAGIGVRYYSSFGPMRFDIGVPLNPREGDANFGIYISLGQAF